MSYHTMFLGLPIYYWVGLLIIVVVFRLTIKREKKSLRNLRRESRPLTEKEREAVEKSPFSDEHPADDAAD